MLTRFIKTNDTQKREGGRDREGEGVLETRDCLTCGPLEGTRQRALRLSLFTLLPHAAAAAAVAAAVLLCCSSFLLPSHHSSCTFQKTKIKKEKKEKEGKGASAFYSFLLLSSPLLSSLTHSFPQFLYVSLLPPLPPFVFPISI